MVRRKLLTAPGPDVAILPAISRRSLIAAVAEITGAAPHPIFHSRGDQ